MQKERRLTGHFYQVEDTGLARGENSALHWLCNASEQKKACGLDFIELSQNNFAGLGNIGNLPDFYGRFKLEEYFTRVTFLYLHGIHYVTMFGRAKMPCSLGISVLLKWSGVISSSWLIHDIQESVMPITSCVVLLQAAHQYNNKLSFALHMKSMVHLMRKLSIPPPDNPPFKTAFFLGSLSLLCDPCENLNQLVEKAPCASWFPLFTGF